MMVVADKKHYDGGYAEKCHDGSKPFDGSGGVFGGCREYGVCGFIGFFGSIESRRLGVSFDAK